MAEKQDSEDHKSLPNIKAPTLGGKQFWTDHHWRQGWKIQRNALTGHWRLIDRRKVRHAWGSRQACQQQLDQLVATTDRSPARIVILIHGLLRSSDSMKPIEKALEPFEPWSVASFEYASTRAPVAAHARALDEFVQSLPTDCQLSFVGHSLGNIVVRHLLGDWDRQQRTRDLKRTTEVIMLGPPNQGAAIARQLSKVGLFEWVTGKSGMELGPEWDEFQAHLATPTCPFGIVAGRLDERAPQNPLVGDEGDFVVGLEETKLDGAADFLEVPRLHSFLMDDPVVQQAVVHFLQHHRFR